MRHSSLSPRVLLRDTRHCKKEPVGIQETSAPSTAHVQLLSSLFHTKGRYLNLCLNTQTATV